LNLKLDLHLLREKNIKSGKVELELKKKKMYSPISFLPKIHIRRGGTGVQNSPLSVYLKLPTWNAFLFFFSLFSAK